MSNLITLKYKYISAKKLVCLLFLLLTFCSIQSASAQPDTTWTSIVENTWDNLRMIRTADGGFAIGTAGWSEDDREDRDFEIIKLNRNCEIEWRRFYPGFVNENHCSDDGLSLYQTEDNGFILAGIVTATVGQGRGAAILRTNEEGEQLWMRNYLREDGFDPPYEALTCIIAADGNIVFNTIRTVIKVSIDDGEVIWISEPENANITAVISADNNLIFVGNTEDQLPDLYIGLFDNDGEPVWQESFGLGNVSEGARYVIEASSGGWCLAGNMRDGQADYPLLARISSEGELIWMRIYEDLEEIDFQSVVETDDGGFAALGSDREYDLLRVDYEGEVLWRATFSLRLPTLGCSVQWLEDRSYALAGFYVGDCWIVRTEEDPVDLPFELEARGDEIDFGNVEIDSSGFAEMVIENTGRRYVVIDSVDITGDSAEFLSDFGLPLRLEPTESADLMFIFNPMRDTTYSANVLLYYGIEDELEITLSGTGFQFPVIMEPLVEQVDFSEVVVDSMVTMEVGIINRGERAAEILSAEISDVNGIFSCELDSSLNCPPSDTIWIPVIFSPDADSTYESLLLLSTGGDTLEIGLIGTGVFPDHVASTIVNEYDLRLFPPVPNPFNSTAWIRFRLEHPAIAEVTVYDMRGSIVQNILEDGVLLSAGTHSFTFKASSGMSSGVYFVQLRAGKHLRTQKLVLVR